jgi:hypothetical protein
MGEPEAAPRVSKFQQAGRLSPRSAADHQVGNAGTDVDKIAGQRPVQRKQTRKGRLYAQHKLGAAYTEGLGVEPDSRLAFEWFSKAAEKGHADSTMQRNNRPSTMTNSPSRKRCRNFSKPRSRQ